jgi:hypothetical protein
MFDCNVTICKDFVMIYPSLLCKSRKELRQNIELLDIQNDLVKSITGNDWRDVRWHIDVITAQFALDYPATVTVSLDTYLAELSMSKALVWDIHLMCSKQEIHDLLRVIDSYRNSEQISELTRVFVHALPEAAVYNSGMHLLPWYNINEWELLAVRPPDNSLMMTILPGKSGLERSETVNRELITRANAWEVPVIADGAQRIDDPVLEKSGVSRVVNSSFWKLLQ